MKRSTSRKTRSRRAHVVARRGTTGRPTYSATWSGSPVTCSISGEDRWPQGQDHDGPTFGGGPLPPSSRDRATEGSPRTQRHFSHCVIASEAAAASPSRVHAGHGGLSTRPVQVGRTSANVSSTSLTTTSSEDRNRASIPAILPASSWSGLSSSSNSRSTATQLRSERRPEPGQSHHSPESVSPVMRRSCPLPVSRHAESPSVSPEGSVSTTRIEGGRTSRAVVDVDPTFHVKHGVPSRMRHATRLSGARGR